ncbi:hypothetical protein MTR67_029881 [Solanum verrucosum]|uniref:Uncharacterized protein n=1 Tax=Solanum verrucosum TaxID=315347 RepID=A0AAF0R6P7_SOLVR|nr:hypothetical protein MTR67_029881 [Solanum verrucosum]
MNTKDIQAHLEKLNKTRECEQDSKISPTRHLLVSVYNVYTHGVVVCTYHHLPNHVFVVSSLTQSCICDT